jgi:hypothetical protein
VRVRPLLSPDTGRRLSIPDVVQNILLFVPFGALGFLACRNGGRAFRAKLRRIERPATMKNGPTGARLGVGTRERLERDFGDLATEVP